MPRIKWKSHAAIGYLELPWYIVDILLVHKLPVVFLQWFLRTAQRGEIVQHKWAMSGDNWEMASLIARTFVKK